MATRCEGSWFRRGPPRRLGLPIVAREARCQDNIEHAHAIVKHVQYTLVGMLSDTQEPLGRDFDEVARGPS
jgi:hypothetical protein